MDELARQPATDYWVVFEDRADLGAADERQDWAARGKDVHDRLVETARASQADLVVELTERGLDFETFWIANRILVREGDQQSLHAALAQDGVVEIQADEPVELPRPIETGADTQTLASGVEWGIANIRADRVWSELGVRGDGVVVGNIDTGVQFTHPALADQYRGNRGDGTFDHDYNWWDPSGACPDEQPCDNNNHGTHTMGTMVGDDGADNQIGVAPQARWIAAKGCEGRSCSIASLLSSGEFMLAPTDLAGNNPRPELRPHVVNNSWSGAGGRDFYDDIVRAWTAAGIFPVFANGNNGPQCATAGSPGDGPQAYSVGAHDSSDVIADFSSRGPGRGEEIKPNISAPGVTVRSSVRGDRYATFDGTSMATPHVAGTVALMWSGEPSLARDIAATRAALDGTAIDTEDLTCGGAAANNNVYGQGRLDALSATVTVAADSGVAGRVTDAANGAGIADAQVRVIDEDLPLSIATRADGRYQLNVLPGTYDVEVSRFGYQPVTVSDVVVDDGEIASVDAALVPLPTGTITGTVSLDQNGIGVPGVTIHGGDGLALTTTSQDGTFTVEAPVGTYTVAARHEMFPASELQQVTVAEGVTLEVDFVLRCSEECNINGLWTDRHDGPASSRDLGNATAVSPDGATVYVTGESPGNGTGSDVATIALDQITGERRWEARYDGPANARDAGLAMRVSPDGATVYVTGPSAGEGPGTDYATIAYEAVTGDQQWVARYDGPGTRNDASLDLDISPDGSTIFVTGLSSGAFNDYATVAYDAATGNELWVARYDGPASTTDAALAVQVAPDGETVHITGYSRPISNRFNRFNYATIAYDAATGEQLWLTRFAGDQDRDLGQDLQVSPDSSKVFVTGYSFGSNSSDFVTIAYDRTTGDELWLARYDGPAHSLDMAFHLGINPDGTAVYATGRSRGIGTSDDYATVAYDTTTGEQLWVSRLDGPINGTDIADAIGVSPDGSAVFVSGHSRGVGTNADYATVGYDTATGDELWRARFNGPVNSFDGARAVVVSPDSTRVFVTGHSFGVDTNRDYATVAYDAASDPERPVFVPWDLQIQPDLAVEGDQLSVAVSVTNVGTAGGDFEAPLAIDGTVTETTEISLDPGETTRVEWTLPSQQPGRHDVSVGTAVVSHWVVGCDTTITGTHQGALTVATGVTCLAEGARVGGPVTIEAGAGMVSTGATIRGEVAADDAAVVLLRDSRVTGPVSVTRTAGLTLIGNQISGNVQLDDNTTDDFAFVLSDNQIVGRLSCTGNTPPPINQGMPNEVTGRATGQCANL